MLRSPITFAICSMSDRPITPPVGFCGEFKMMSFVRSLISESNSFTSSEKSRSSRSAIGTARPPT